MLVRFRPESTGKFNLNFDLKYSWAARENIPVPLGRPDPAKTTIKRRCWPPRGVQRRPTYEVSFGGGSVPLDLRFRGPFEAKSFVRGLKIDPPGAP